MNQQDNSFNMFGASEAMLKGGLDALGPFLTPSNGKRVTVEHVSPQEFDRQFESIFGKPQSTETLPIIGYYVVAVQEGKATLFLSSNLPRQEGDPYFWTAEPKLALREDDLNRASARYFDQFAQNTALPDGYDPEHADIGVRPGLLGPKLNTKPKVV